MAAPLAENSTTSVHNLTWTKASPTTIERSIDHCERFYQFIHAVGQGRPDKQHWHTTSAIKIKTPLKDFKSEVQQAWLHLRFEFPTWSAYIEDDRWVYNLVDEEEQSLWLQETFQVHNGTETARQLYPFDSNPSRRMVLHVLPRTQELVIQGPHTHSDARGTATFWKRLTEILAGSPSQSPAWGTEGQNLTPALSIVTELPQHTEEQKQKWDSILQNWISQFPTLRVHNDNKGAAAGRTIDQWMVFNEKETKSIADAVKKHGVSVTAAIQAALSLAAREHGQLDNTTHATLGIFDARGYINPQKHSHERLVGPHVFALPAVFKLNADSLVETARNTRDEFANLRKDNFVRDISPVWVKEIPGVLAAYPPEAPVAADVQLSSVGVMDKYVPAIVNNHSGAGYPTLEIEDLWMSIETLSPHVLAIVWTFRGKLHINLAYNEVYHSEASIKSLLSLIHDEISKGLDLELGFDAKTPVDTAVPQLNGKIDAVIKTEGGIQPAATLAV